MKRQSHPGRKPCGLTLVESLAGLAIVALAAGIAAPGFGAAMERRHLEGASAQLRTDIYMGRSQAVAQNRNLRISFARNTAGSCYVVHTGSATSCTCVPGASPLCNGGARALRSASFPAAGALDLHSNVSSIVMDAAKGTVSPTGTMRFTGRQGRELRLIVNIMGRVRFCTPSPSLKGYPPC